MLLILTCCCREDYSSNAKKFSWKSVLYPLVQTVRAV